MLFRSDENHAAPRLTGPHHPGRSGVRWEMIGLACVASFIAYILRINMSVISERSGAARVTGAAGC